MPKIQISETLFYSLLGYTPTFADLTQQLTCAKAEIDEEKVQSNEETKLTIELNDTNRPDLWSLAGLSRALNTYHNQNANTLSKRYSFFYDDPDPQRKIIVDKELQHIRPYVLSFIISGKKITNALLLELIQTQEKLCDNYGQHREGVSIGIYREHLISWPVYYTAADPEATSFVPLDYDGPEDSVPNLPQILKDHPKGQEYGHILAGHNKYPMLTDKEGKVLSLVPIINSAEVGAVKIGDDSLLIECTGANLEQLMLVMNIFACDCHDLGFTITRINTQYPYKIENRLMAKVSINIEEENNQTTQTLLPSPLHFQEPKSVELEEICTLLSEKLNQQQVQQALTKMGIQSTLVTDSQIEIEVPPYRNDFLHSVDIIEDVLIGLGLDSFIAEPPKNYTIGRLTDIERLSRKAINVMVGLGFQEMIYPYLGSKEDLIEKMYEKHDWQRVQDSMVQIANPISAQYEFVRASILPNLLETERVSAHSPYPHRICEMGKVVVRNDAENYGSSTLTSLGFVIADSAIGFTDINSILAALFYYLNIKEWHLEMLYDSRLIEGRSGKIIRTLDGKTEEVGVFGELHPRVLEKHAISMPCVAGEIILERLQ